jgi:hypothetical protein
MIGVRLMIIRTLAETHSAGPHIAVVEGRGERARAGLDAQTGASATMGVFDCGGCR